MATNTKRASGEANKGSEPGEPGSAFPFETNPAQSDAALASAQGTSAPEATGGPQGSPTDALPENPRGRPPASPLGLVGASSRDAVAQVTLALQQGEVQGRQHGAQGWEAAAAAALRVNVAHLHPLVAAYRAEAREYLLARAKDAADRAAQ